MVAGAGMDIKSTKNMSIESSENATIVSNKVDIVNIDR